MIKPRKKNKDTVKRTCRQCAHHYDEHEKAHDGKMIVARCPFKRYCVLLDYAPDTCDHFNKIEQHDQRINTDF